ALVYVAMIDDFAFLFSAQSKTVRSAAKLFAKCAHEAPGRVVNNDSFAAHTRFVDGVRHVNKAVLILRESVCVPPNKPIRRNQPIVNTFIRVNARTHDRQPATRLVGCLEKKAWHCNRCDCRLCTLFQKVTTPIGFHAIKSGTTFAGTTPVSFCSNPWNLNVNLS